MQESAMSGYLRGTSQSVAVKNGDLENILGSLSVLSRAKLPGATSLKVARLVGKLQPLFREFLSERKALAEDYCKRGEDGKPAFIQLNGQEVYDFTPENKKELDVRAGQLEQVANDVDVKLFTEREFEEIQIEPAALLYIEQFIYNGNLL